MQFRKKLVITSILTILVSGVFADDFNPYTGIDYQQTWMKANTNGLFTTKNITPKSYPGANAYIGTKFAENFGIELGAGSTTNKKKNWSEPEEILGVDGTVAGNTKIRLSNFYLDLIGFLPITENTEIFGSVGASLVKAKIAINFLTFNGSQLTSAQLSDLGGQLSISTNLKTVLRFGIGANYMITDSIGVRGKLGLENTSNLKPKNSSQKLFKNSQTFLVGAFFRF